MPVIGRQYGASFGNLFPYHFGCDAVFPFVVLILPDGDVFHFGRDDPVSGIPQLGMEFSSFSLSLIHGSLTFGIPFRMSI